MDTQGKAGARPARWTWLPAAAIVLAGPAQAALFCAHDATELQTALTTAGGNTQDNEVRIANGTFTTSAAPFNFGTINGFALTIEGGYDAGCATQDPSPGRTVLDGAGLTRVLTIQTNGFVEVRHVTIQNASFGGSAGAGGQISLGIGNSGVAVFADNVVRDNASSFAGGGFTFLGNGTLYIQNNLFTGNSAPATAAFATNMGDGSTSYITNNTITDNTNTDADRPITAIGGSSPTAIAYVTNTISYGNHGSGLKDFYLYGFQTVQFVANDYTTIDGAAADGSGDNLIGVDPKFAGADDFHLLSTSPLLRAGSLTPAGGLPATDLEGNPRSVDNQVDIGAYENADFIFADGFEN
jgi:hypothetical protein